MGPFVKMFCSKNILTLSLNSPYFAVEPNNVGLLRTDFDRLENSISDCNFNAIRLGEVLRAQKDFLADETAFKAVLEMAESNQDVIVMKNFSLARICFQEALEIREKKVISLLSKVRSLLCVLSICELNRNTNLTLSSD